MGGHQDTTGKRKPPAEDDDDAPIADNDGITEADEPEPDEDDLDDPDATADHSRTGADGGIDEH